MTERQYLAFLDALITTLGEFGEATPELADAWRGVLDPALRFLATCQVQAAPPSPVQTARS